jgi:pimeloyl-ACP methyl ester carboxylesterase
MQVSQLNEQNEMADIESSTIILAHGAWADGSSWSEVISTLTVRGISVIAAPLPLTSLSDDAAALQRTIDRTQGPVILAGHAYAGAVIATATDKRVKGLVYITALAPDRGETVSQVFYRDESHALAPKLAPDAEGWIWMPDEGFSNAFAQRATPQQIALCRAVQRPISVQCIQEPAPEPLWKTKPSWFLIAEEDRMISPKTQRFMAERMGASIRAFPVDHTPLLTAPETVAGLILAAVQTTLSARQQSV